MRKKGNHILRGRRNTVFCIFLEEERRKKDEKYHPVRHSFGVRISSLRARNSTHATDRKEQRNKDKQEKQIENGYVCFALTNIAKRNKDRKKIYAL